VVANPDSQIVNVVDVMMGQARIINEVEDDELSETREVEKDLIVVAIIKANEELNFDLSFNNIFNECICILTCNNSTIAGGVFDRSEKDNRPGWLSEACATVCDISADIDRSVEDNLELRVKSMLACNNSTIAGGVVDRSGKDNRSLNARQLRWKMFLAQF